MTQYRVEGILYGEYHCEASCCRGHSFWNMKVDRIVDADNEKEAAAIAADEQITYQADEYVNYYEYKWNKKPYVTQYSYPEWKKMKNIGHPTLPGIGIYS